MSVNQTIAFTSDLMSEDDWSTQIPGARETMRHKFHRAQPSEILAEEIVSRGTKPMIAGILAAGLIASAPAAQHRPSTHSKAHTAHVKAKPKVHRKRTKIRIRRHRIPRDTYSGPINETPLAVTTWMEARNQKRPGRLAVMHVIKNRVLANKRMFGIGLRGVCHKPWQYSAWNRNDDSQRVAFFNMLQLPEDHPEKILWRSIQKDAKLVWNGDNTDNTGGATYYHTPAVKPKWRYDMTVVGQIGDHIFYREMTTRERKLKARDDAANRRLKKARKIARRANTRQVTMTISIRYKTRTSQAVPMRVAATHRR